VDGTSYADQTFYPLRRTHIGNIYDLVLRPQSIYAMDVDDDVSAERAPKPRDRLIGLLPQTTISHDPIQANTQINTTNLLSIIMGKELTKVYVSQVHHPINLEAPRLPSPGFADLAHGFPFSPLDVLLRCRS
jgi:hypothetical protein